MIRLCRFSRILALFGALLAVSGGAWASTVKTDHVTAQIVAEPGTLRPGKTLWVMLHLEIKDGWHTYWRNPGDSGQPPDIAWTLPDGVTAGAIHWPYPDELPYGPLLNYGYSDNAYHLVPIALSESWPEGKPVDLNANATWLACSDICVPESGSFTLSLPTAATTPQTNGESAKLFRAARERLPAETDWKAGLATTGDKVVLTLSGDALDGTRIRKATFFPYEWGLIEPSANQQLATAANGLSLTMTAGQTPNKERLDGVLVLTSAPGDGPATRAYAISARAGVDAGIVPAPAASAPETSVMTGGDASGGTDITLLTAFLFALLGGIILNLMPCVFPILSMKAMALIRHAEKDPRTVRLHGLAYAAGVLACFAVLATVLIALKAGGAATGWGFQLQSPVFIALMAYLFFLLGLNLSGVFEIGTSIMGIGSGLSSRSGYGGSFFTGVLAAVVSTPCTAPFMGVALGFALTQPAAVALAVFLALGVGFALPYLLLTFVPALVRLLPKPGVWMERTRQFLAFPLYASVAWLIWVLAIQTGPDGVVAALGGMVLLGFAVWLAKVTRDARAHGRLFGRAGSTVAAVAALVLIVGLGAMSTPTATVSTTGRSATGPVYEPFSTERLAALRAAGKPVFVNMTAAWCITCLVNERVALSSATVNDRFAALDITYLKGDWTNGDPQITALLESFGRSGVPLYVLYGPGNAKPILLPQLLTETLVLDALQDLSDQIKITAKTDRSSS